MDKKVLILTLTCGEGHNAIAKSFSSKFSSLGIENNVVDLFESRPRMKKLNNDSYIWACKHIPYLYQHFWRIERKKYRKFEKSPQVKSIKSVVPYFKDLINNYKPTDIICVQVADGALISYMKLHNLIDPTIKTYTVMFDYVLCPYWETNIYLDYVISPLEVCNNDLLKVGFKQEQIKTLGFPTNSQFYQNLDKENIRKKLGIKQTFTFFSIAGGNGIGNSLTFLKKILKVKGDYQVIMICGKNKKNRLSIEKYIIKNNIKNVLCVGFVNNIKELMSASDVAITRGGGAGITECFYSSLPIIFREGLINNEIENRDLFVKLGCGLKINKTNTITKICQNLINSPDTIEAMKENIKKVLKPCPIDNICNFVINNK